MWSTVIRKYIFILIPWVMSIGVLAQDQPEPFSKKSPIPLNKYYAPKVGPPIWRKILSHLDIHFSTGISYNQYTHSLSDGFGLAQEENGQPTIYRTTENPVDNYYSNWISNPGVVHLTQPTFIMDTDTAQLGFKSSSRSLPFNAMLQVKFIYFRLGVGYMIEFIRLNPFRPTAYADKINPIVVSPSSSRIRKYYVMFGASVYKRQKLAFITDVHVGKYTFTKNFDLTQIVPATYFNIGVTGEWELSEYLKISVRPSIEVKKYGVKVSESTITHHIRSVYGQIGFTYTLPQLPRCFIRRCHTQINHSHGNKSYRSREHPIYKKQNPGYGENDRPTRKRHH